MLLVLTYKLFWNVAIVYGDGGSGLKNKNRTIIKNVSVFCNEDHLWTIKRKSCSWKRKKNICIAWIFSWYMHWNIIQIIIRCFGAVSSSEGSTTNIDGNEYFGLGKIQCCLFAKSGLMRKQKYAFFISGRFPQYLGERILLSCQFYFRSTHIILQRCFKNLWMVYVWSK